MEANIARPAGEIHNEAAAQTVSPPRLRDSQRDRAELSLAGCCFLSSSHAGEPREGVGGGRGRGEAVLLGQSAGIFTSRQQEVRAGRALPSSRWLALTTSQLGICLQLLGTVTTQTPCVSGGRRAAVHSSHPEAAHLPPGLRELHASLASLSLDCSRWRQEPRKDRPTDSIPGESANTGAARHKGGRDRATRNLAPCGHKQVFLDPVLCSGPLREYHLTVRWLRREESFPYPLLNSLWFKESCLCS